jgi:ketosteroid isomerase-like protein
MTTEDNEGIRELLAKYCHYVDAANADEWADLYVDEGSLALNMGGPPIEGKEALRAFASALSAGNGLHLSANPMIAVDGSEATVQSYIVVISDRENPHLMLGGRYDDRLRRVDGEWKFVRRELHADFMKRP